MNVAALTALLTPVLTDRGLELDDLTVVPAGRRSLLRVTVDGDGPRGLGPTLDEIAGATRAISAALDESPVTGNAPYVLEVSSRGVGKPLTKPVQWRRNKGRLVQMTVAGASVAGRIGASDEDSVTLDVAGAERTYGYTEISKATVQVELNRKPDPDLDEVGDLDGDEFDDDIHDADHEDGED